MRDVSGAGKVKERTMDAVAGRAKGREARTDAAMPKPRSYADIPETGKKWPLIARVAFITGSATILWGLIFLGYKSL